MCSHCLCTWSQEARFLNVNEASTLQLRTYVWTLLQSWRRTSGCSHSCSLSLLTSSVFSSSSSSSEAGKAPAALLGRGGRGRQHQQRQGWRSRMLAARCRVVLGRYIQVRLRVTPHLGWCHRTSLCLHPSCICSDPETCVGTKVHFCSCVFICEFTQQWKISRHPPPP